ncbi:MAG: DUF3127 domain-containing protein [Bacteroidia bacterium]|nr:DUF3127 domain-containing protein [Bacteroidia bacterium]
MDIIGRIKAIFETQKISDRFSKREFVLTIDENSPYPQYITFQLVQDRCSLIDQYAVGDEVKVFFNLKGREWKNPEGQIKYFNTIEAWKIEKIGHNNPNDKPIYTQNTTYSNANLSEPAYPEQGKPVFNASDSDFNDLPF